MHNMKLINQRLENIQQQDAPNRLRANVPNTAVDGSAFHTLTYCM